MPSTNPAVPGCGFHHVCIKTRDWDATMRFYRDALGFVEKVAWRAAPQRAAMLDTGDGNYLEVFEDAGYAPAPNGAVLHFALRTANVDAVAERVRAAGAKITMEPKDVTIQATNGIAPVPVRIAFCEGPSGEVIEFFQNDRT
jgi:catechol 2,3-dioxygenase-like lactoylglutathione lyase family enzyme